MKKHQSRGHTSYMDDPAPKVVFAVEVPVVFYNDGDNGDTSLDGKMEAAFLERQQVWCRAAVARALGIHPQGDAQGPHHIHGRIERAFGTRRVSAIDEDGAGHEHEWPEGRKP
jgi:hypothetical protein